MMWKMEKKKKTTPMTCEINETNFQILYWEVRDAQEASAKQINSHLGKEDKYCIIKFINTGCKQ